MYILLDIGGTSTRVASSKNLKTIAKIEKFPTEKNFTPGIEKVHMSIKKIAQDNKITAIVLGIAGIHDKKAGKILASPNLHSWVNKPIVANLKKTYHCPVFLENDTDLGGLGEAVFGAGKKYTIVGYYAIGTGLGGVRIVNKRIDISSQGFEPGHQIIKPDGKKWPPCGQVGCLESLVSGTAFYKNYGIQPENCKNKKIWNDFSKYLAQGIINALVLWSPDIFIIGGGFSERSRLFLNQTKEYVKKNLLVFKSLPIIKSKLGDKAGLYGGLHFLKTRKI
ncbi:ROK family protein [Patescibacteria group bacterium AH-259-L07]|nr:ROK family protein [Patescibacteria group bacterium AH-259-L07]